MSLDVLALVVAAAFAHAGWNLLAQPAVWAWDIAGTAPMVEACEAAAQDDRARVVAMTLRAQYLYISRQAAAGSNSSGRGQTRSFSHARAIFSAPVPRGRTL